MLLKYEEFIDYIKEHLISYFEPGTSIIVHRVLKNNNTELDGISVLKKNQTISPTLYLNDYYEEYMGGSSLEELLDNLYSNFLHPHTAFSFSISEFKNFNLMRDKIIYRLVNYEQNQTLLKNIPYQQFLDLAIVYYILLYSDQQGNACIMVRNEHLDIWDIKQELLHQYATYNTPILLPAKIRHMDELIYSFLDTTIEEEQELLQSLPSSSIPMYVFTNQSNLNGASVLLYKDVIWDFACSQNENFYIIPSSIHELILVPANGILSKASLEFMVNDVNQKEVSPMERLSNHVYFYDRFTQTITM